MVEAGKVGIFTSIRVLKTRKLLKNRDAPATQSQAGQENTIFDAGVSMVE